MVQGFRVQGTAGFRVQGFIVHGFRGAVYNVEGGACPETLSHDLFPP